jgi:hypothetical protein
VFPADPFGYISSHARAKHFSELFSLAVAVKDYSEFLKLPATLLYEGWLQKDSTTL